MDKFFQSIGKIAIYLFLFAVISILMAFPTKWLLNWILSPWLLVHAFGGALTVYKAWGWNVLFGSIAKGISGSSKEK